MAIRRYCFLYPKGEELPLTPLLETYNLFRNPIAYSTGIYPEYELLVDGVIKEDLVNYSDYDVFWELIYKLWKDDAFRQNQTYLNYGATDVLWDSDYIQFVRDNQEWRIYLTFPRLKREYPVEQKYLVFFDENDNISTSELYGAMTFFVNKLGKENNYTDVLRYDYQDTEKSQKFFIFYYGDAPSLDRSKSIIREDLVTRFGYDDAKVRYPALFVDSTRRVFVMYENEGYPINFEKAKAFIGKHNIFYPEIILLLDWQSPVVVENGLSDIIPEYTPIVEDDVQSNKFIFFLSKVINYLEGRVLTPDFVKEAQFSETETYASFVFSGIEWQVQKIKN